MPPLTATPLGPPHAGAAGLPSGLKSARSQPASRRIVLDGINWEAVASRMGTRNPQQCKEKWCAGHGAVAGECRSAARRG